MSDEQTPPARDPAIVKHMRALGEAAEARSIELFTAALDAVREDPSLSPAQRGAILKTIAQEQAATYHMIITKTPFTERVGAPPPSSK